MTPPPAGPVEENVHVVIVNDVSEYFDPAYRKLDEELVSAWEKKNITLGLYYYEGLAKLVPAYFPHLVDHELKDKHRRGFTSLRCEVDPGWPWTGPMAYVTAQLWWNVDLNVDDLLQEYFTMLYGPAAKPMERLYDLFEQIHMRSRSGGFLYEHGKFVQFRPYTAEDLAAMRALLAEAHSLAVEQKGPYAPPKDDIAQRVAYVSNGLRVFLTMLDGYTRARELERPMQFDDISALQLLENIDRMNAILTTHDALYRETIRGDRFQSSRYTWDRCISLRNGWKTFVASAIGKSLADLYNWNLSEQVDVRVQERLNRALAEYTADPYRRYIWHRDHRITGQVVLDAAFPYARDHLSYPDLYEEGLKPHKVKEILLWASEDPNYYSDISETFETKLAALRCHESQVGGHHFPAIEQWLRQRAEDAARDQDFALAEAFHRAEILW